MAAGACPPSSWTRDAAAIASMLSRSVDEATLANAASDASAPGSSTGAPHERTPLSFFLAACPSLTYDVSSTKGRCVRASHALLLGDVITSESSVACWIHDHTGAVRSMRELQDSWTFTPPWDGDVEAAYRTLLQLTAGGSTAHPSDEYLRSVMKGDAAREEAVRVAPRAFVLHRIAMGNKYGVQFTRETLDDWERATGTVIPHPYSPQRWVGTLFMALSLINHDCEPNATVHVEWDTELHAAVGTVTALRDIAAGEEITISYVPTSFPLAERQAIFKTEYKFVCKCARCRREFMESAGGAVALAAATTT